MGAIKAILASFSSSFMGSSANHRGTIQLILEHYSATSIHRWFIYVENNEVCDDYPCLNLQTILMV